MKKIIFLLCILVLMLSVLCACGKKKEPETQAQTTDAVPQTETQTEKPTETETKKPMDSGELVDIVFKDLKLSTAYAADIKVNAMDAEGNIAVTVCIVVQNPEAVKTMFLKKACGFRRSAPPIVMIPLQN